jgi:integrase
VTLHRPDETAALPFIPLPRDNSLMAQILSLGDVVRTQNPQLQCVGGKWLIRPYVEIINEQGQLERVQKRVYLGSAESLSKKQAVAEKNKALRTLNDSQYVAQAQVPFGEFLKLYEKNHVRSESVGAATRAKYLCHLKNHIRPAFEEFRMAELTTLRIQGWLNQKAKSGLSWSTRADLRNLMSGIFEKAAAWGYWKDRNPLEGIDLGRNRPVREKRKLTTEQTRALLKAIAKARPEVALICKVALFCGLRISEVLGLQWKHVDFKRGVLMIRQRYHRGDLDEPKSRRATRDVPMGNLAQDLQPGRDEDFVFNVRTYYRGGVLRPTVCRDDRDILQHFVRPSAVALGLYYPGFGFHAFRREAVTSMAHEADAVQAMKMAGHAKLDMTELYGLSDLKRQAGAVRRHQAKVMGKSLRRFETGAA